MALTIQSLQRYRVFIRQILPANPIRDHLARHPVHNTTTRILLRRRITRPGQCGRQLCQIAFNAEEIRGRAEEEAKGPTGPECRVCELVFDEGEACGGAEIIA